MSVNRLISAAIPVGIRDRQLVVPSPSYAPTQIRKRKPFVGGIERPDRKRQQREISFAREIRMTKLQLRAVLLSSDYVIRRSFGLLRGVLDRTASLDRIVDVPLSDQRKKQEIRARLPDIVDRLAKLLEQNRQDFRISIRKSQPVGERDAAMRRVRRRRQVAARLIQQAPLRDEHIDQLYSSLCELSQRIEQVQTHINAAGTKAGMTADYQWLVRDRRRLILVAGDSPARLAKRVAHAKQLNARHRTAVRQFAEANLSLVVYVAKNFQQRGLALSELIQEGNLGLMQAVRRFDDRRKCRFSTYAVCWIRKAIYDALARSSFSVRIPRQWLADMTKVRTAVATLRQRLQREPTVEETATAADLPVDKTRSLLIINRRSFSLRHGAGYGSTNQTSEELFPNAMPGWLLGRGGELPLGSAIKQVLGDLTERERDVIERRYGLDGTDGQTLDRIGRALNVTRERVRQIESRAFGKLRKARCRNVLAGYLD